MNHELDPEQRARIVAEAVEVLLAGYLPDDVREGLDGNLPARAFDQSELTPFQSRALRQAGVDAGQVAVQVLQVEIVQLRRDFERIERDLATQAEGSITEGRIIFIVFGVLAAIAVVVALWKF